MNRSPILLVALVLGACAMPPKPHGLDPEVEKALKANRSTIGSKPDAALEQALIPPLRIELPKVDGKSLEPRFDLAVREAPAQQVFMSLVTGTRYSMLVHPDVDGKITVTLKDVTVTEALDAIRELYGYEYTIAGTRISVHANAIQTRVFKVNYLAGARIGRSDVKVSAGSIGASSGATGAAGAATSGTLPASQISTAISADFWTTLIDTLKVIVADGDAAGVATAAPASGNNSGGNAAGGLAGAGGAAGTGAAQGANAMSAGALSGSGIIGKSSYTVNPQAGVIVVRAMPKVIRRVEEYLKAIQVSVERQVMLEAKIIEVTLSDAYQAGINWQAFPTNAANFGFLQNGTTLGSTGIISNSVSTYATDAFGRASTLSAPTGIPGVSPLGLFSFALQYRNFASLLTFLEAQGTVQVLSSPRISTLNNQKAVLKVGTDELFITGITGGSTSTASSSTTVNGVTTQLPTVVTQPFFSGVALDITPQIDEEGAVTLHVHPAVTSVEQQTRTLSLGSTIGNVTIPTPRIVVSETDSIVKVANAQIVAIGGLMKVDSSDARTGLPGAQDLPGVGGAFGTRTKSNVKKELVILIKPTVVGADSSEETQADLSRTRDRFLELGRQMSNNSSSVKWESR